MSDGVIDQEGNSRTVGSLDLDMRLEGIFTPYARKRRDALSVDGIATRSRFVHYTSAEAALNIIRKKRLWLRNTSCMGDYREVQHGFDTLRIVLASASNHEELSEAFNGCFPDLASEAFRLFDQWWSDIHANTYIASISEHDEKENAHGRLSMWRAFGGSAARVAVVLNIPWFSGGAEALNVVFSPVAYFGVKQVHEEVRTVIQQIKTETKFLQSVGRPTLLRHAFNMLLAAVTCMKHEGFHEEREWRVIYGPKRTGSQLMEQSTQVIAGIPQIVYEMPLDVAVSQVLAGLDVANLVERVIIGPTQYPAAIGGAFIDTMGRAGIPNPEERVCVSGIPIRA